MMKLNLIAILCLIGSVHFDVATAADEHEARKRMNNNKAHDLMRKMLNKKKEWTREQVDEWHETGHTNYESWEYNGKYLEIVECMGNGNIGQGLIYKDTGLDPKDLNKISWLKWTFGFISLGLVLSGFLLNAGFGLTRFNIESMGFTASSPSDCGCFGPVVMSLVGTFLFLGVLTHRGKDWAIQNESGTIIYNLKEKTESGIFAAWILCPLGSLTLSIGTVCMPLFPDVHIGWFIGIMSVGALILLGGMISICIARSDLFCNGHLGCQRKELVGFFK